MIGGRLGGRIGRGWVVGRVLGRRSCLAEGVIDFVSRDVDETKGVVRLARERRSVKAGRFQQGVGPDDVGADEGARGRDRTIDMTFGGKVKNHIRSFGGD